MPGVYKVAGFGFLVLTSKYVIDVFEILYDIKLQREWREHDHFKRNERPLVGHWATAALLSGTSMITGYIAYWCLRK